MTTAQPMHHRALRAARRLLACAIVAGVPLVSACAPAKGPAPLALASPYHSTRALVVAVAPLRNESGTTTVDELALSDTLVNELGQTPGINVLPINRTLAGMRALDIASVDTPGQAGALARALGADAIVVGSITAWNPYDPPVIGLSLGLFGVTSETGVPGPSASATSSSDPLALRGAATEFDQPRARVVGPTSVVADVLDASNGAVRERLREYAAGRFDPRSALQWKQYTASMALYAKFACFEMSRRLLSAEQSRLAEVEALEQQ